MFPAGDLADASAAKLSVARWICSKLIAAVPTRFARVQSRRYDSAAAVGHGISSGALRNSFLLQLLVRFARASDLAQLEFAELLSAVAQSDIRTSASAFHTHRGFGDCVRAAARLSAGLLPFVSCGKAQGPALSTGDHSAVGELPGAGVCVEDDSGQRRRAERISAISAHHAQARGVFSLQPVCRDHYFDAYLHAVHAAADLRIARTHSAEF